MAQVVGDSTNGIGVEGASTNSAGVKGSSRNFDGVQGFSAAPLQGGVVGTNTGRGIGVIAQSTAGTGLTAKGGRLAAFFDGNIQVRGDVTLVKGQGDCAEDFEIANADLVEPGTVMRLNEGGVLEPCQFAYDKHVVGVISGAGSYKPGIVLDKRDDEPNCKPVALVGKVYCKVDAQYGAIETGDLLTTSPTLGHAMKAADSQRAFGAVIGKALRPVLSGRDLIPILVALQ